MLQVRQAKEEGVTKVNQQHKASQERTTSSNLTDMGWVAVRTRGQLRPRQLLRRLYVVDWEVIVNACGVAMTKLQGHSWAPPLISGRK